MSAALSRRSFVKATGAATALTTGGALARTVPLNLLDGRLGAQHGPRSMRLDDPLRQWHAGLGATVAAYGATALVRWDMALMLRQLAREARLPCVVGGGIAGLFTVTLGKARPIG